MDNDVDDDGQSVNDESGAVMMLAMMVTMMMLTFLMRVMLIMVR